MPDAKMVMELGTKISANLVSVRIDVSSQPCNNIIQLLLLCKSSCS
jgi:hypothetical protein